MSLARGVLLLGLLAPPALAQSGYRSARDGFWFGGGLGAGAGSLECGICESGGGQGTSGYLRAGMALNPRLLLGGETSGWQKSGEAGKRRILVFSAGAWWYPRPGSGQFFHGAIGTSRWRASREQEAVISRALALTVGAGFEARVGPRLSLVPFVNLVGSANGALWLEKWDESSYQRRRLPASGHTLLLMAGIGLTRH
jgi:hypothetical protein